MQQRQKMGTHLDRGRRLARTADVGGLPDRTGTDGSGPESSAPGSAVRSGLDPETPAGAGGNRRRTRTQHAGIQSLERQHPDPHIPDVSGCAEGKGIPGKRGNPAGERNLHAVRYRPAESRCEFHGQPFAGPSPVFEHGLHGHLPAACRNPALRLSAAETDTAAGTVPACPRTLAAGQKLHCTGWTAAADRRGHPDPVCVLPVLSACGLPFCGGLSAGSGRAGTGTRLAGTAGKRTVGKSGPQFFRKPAG